MSVKFLICNHCKNIISFESDSGVTPYCCGEEMKEISCNIVEASHEKHIPAVTINDNVVKCFVGSVTHPMEEKHYIQWICLETKKTKEIKYLKPGDEPKGCFRICKHDEFVAVYAYCNLHGLWKFS